MSEIMIIHVSAGTLAVLSGAVALIAPKGQPVHRAAGNIFFITMLMTAIAGAYTAWVKPEIITVLAGAFTCYLVLTSWVTVKRNEKQIGSFEIAALVVIIAIATISIFYGLSAMNSETGLVNGFSHEAFFFFGGLATLASLLDISVIARSGIGGRQRIARHLWRMTLALFIAAGSLFTGPGAGAFPEWLRNTGILSAPELLILLAMFFWLVRVLFTKWYTAEDN